MGRKIGLTLTLIAALAGHTLSADDLTGEDRFLCGAVQATMCFEGGDCAVDLPSNFNIPQFIEIDLDAMRLSTTEASGLGRTTEITHLGRQDGTIFLQGHEMGRGFTFAVTEATGQVTVAIAAQGGAVIVFGACTPITDE